MRQMDEQRRAESELASEKPAATVSPLRDRMITLPEATLRGIGHDINNLLTVVHGCMSLAKAQTEEGSRLAPVLHEAEKAALHASRLAGSILHFAEGSLPEKRLSSIGMTLRELTALALSGSDVRCEFDLSPDLSEIECDEIGMARLIINLATNARQAMKEEGHLKVTASNVHLPSNDSTPLPEGQYVRIVFVNGGAAISPANIQRIFDPYFSTKNGGTGLGLAVASEIVRDHNGHIHVDSQEGVGTTFTIYLPAAE